jgi:hypothetical protein
MYHRLHGFVIAIAGLLAAPPVPALRQARPQYVRATAYHVLPETHNNESGYFFSLCEGRDGNLYVGTAEYGENAFLVEFDPRNAQLWAKVLELPPGYEPSINAWRDSTPDGALVLRIATSASTRRTRTCSGTSGSA